MIIRIILWLNDIVPFLEANIIPFVILLGALIFFHEFGHFIIAKLIGVRVEEFSLGFPPKLIGKKIGETEYKLSLLPIGGFVKLSGQDDFGKVTIENKPYEFYSKSPYQRLLIVAAGPVFNFILGLLLFIFVFNNGQTVTYNPAHPGKIGGIIKNSPAYKAGLHIGDEILKVDSDNIESWNDLIELSLNPQSKNYNMTINRNGKIVNKRITPEKIGMRYMMGIIQYQEPVIGSIHIENSKKNQNYSKIKINSTVKSIIVGNKTYPIRQWKEINEFVFFNYDKKINLVTEYNGKINIIPVKPNIQTMKQVGSYPFNFKLINDNYGYHYSNILSNIKPNSELYKTGFRNGDIIININGNPVYSKMDITEAIAGSPEKKSKITVKRDKMFKKFNITPEKKDFKFASLSFFPKVYHEDYSLTESIVKSFNKVTHICVQTVQVLGKVITGKMQAKDVLGGPITIWRITVFTAKTGITEFLILMAVISINLGFINLFPIPVLDGGHILIYIWEIFSGKMPSEKTMNMIQHVGLAILLVLIIFTFYIDILRL